MAIIIENGEAGKKCTRCGFWKPLAKFSKRKVGDGYQAHCKECRARHEKSIREKFPERQKMAKRKYRLKNSEKISQYRKQYYRSNREAALIYARRYREGNLQHIKDRERRYYARRLLYILDRRKRYYILHAEEARQYARKYFELNREQVQAYKRRYRKERPEIARAWRDANRDKLKAIKQRRRARKRSAGRSFTAMEWKALKQKYDFTCLSCGLKEPEIKLVPDHIIPLGPPGTGLIDNIQPLCETCNKRKATKTTDYRNG